MKTKKFEQEELHAQFLLPDPIAGRHWTAHRQSLIQNQDEDPITAVYRAALVVIEGGSYEDADGGTHTIDENAPLAVLVWLGNTVSEEMNQATRIPKNSSREPSTPPTPAASSPETETGEDTSSPSS